ncbi:YtzI protein [Bacillus sp. FJAT-27225]|uniref:YtzI protein n=1 Tax=Bacillus sp. FJAT-27225 TaxID=1743144 RepID=UPI000980B0A6|nr:YtzI protein [Bacillus sp. FJAT-27225]
MIVGIIMVLSFVIFLVVIALAVITTNKAYAFRHTVDPADESPSLVEDRQEKKA